MKYVLIAVFVLMVLSGCSTERYTYASNDSWAKGVPAYEERYDTILLYLDDTWVFPFDTFGKIEIHKVVGGFSGPIYTIKMYDRSNQVIFRRESNHYDGFQLLRRSR